MPLVQVAIMYREESRVMARCADLSRSEDGLSYYAQRMVRCAQIADALEQAHREMENK